MASSKVLGKGLARAASKEPPARLIAYKGEF